MATKKTAKKAAKKSAGKKMEKKAPAKKTGAAKTAVKKSAAVKSAPVKNPTFHIFAEGEKKFLPAEQAKAVRIDGFEAFSLFLHKSVDGKGWTVSEASSGGRIAVGFTQKEAKEKAAEALGKHGADDFAESIRRSIAKNGVAPGFEKPNSAGNETAEPPKTPVVTTRLKSRILAALVDEKKLPREQVHFDEIAKTTGADVGDVAAALMALELERKVLSLPGKFFRLPKGDEQKPLNSRGRKPNDALSQLDAAVEILKDAKEPLACKEIVRRMFEKNLWSTNGRTPGATLSASLQREIAKRGAESRFRKAERGLYAVNA